MTVLVEATNVHEKSESGKAISIWIVNFLTHIAALRSDIFKYRQNRRFRALLKCKRDG
jgi:hypothetical protein